MILKLICNMAITILEMLFTIIKLVAPSLSFTEYIVPFLELITETIQTSVNFIYFILGEAMYPFLTFAIALLGYRFLIFPTIVIIRRIFIKGGDT